MDIREIRYFTEVAREQNITRAAKNLYLSQPALSRAIKKIEDEFHTKLFTAIDRRMVLTDRGLEIYKLSQELLEKYNTILDTLLCNDELYGGKIDLAMPLINSQKQFMQLFIEFFKKYPRIQLNVYEKGDHETEEAVFEGRVDIGVVMKTSQKGQFDEIDILTSEVFVLAHEGKLYAQKGFVSPEDLKDDMLFLQSDDYALFNEVCDRFRAVGISPHIGFTSARRELLVSLAKQCNGAVIMPHMILQTEEVENMKMIPFYEPFCCGLTIITRKNRHLSDAAELLIFEIQKYFKKIQDNLPCVSRPHLNY